MYKSEGIFEDQVFELDMTLPVNASATATNAVRATGSPGRLAVRVTAANGSVALANGNKLTISLKTSDTYAGSYVVPKYSPSMVVTMDAAYSPDEGDTIARLIIPTGIMSEETAKWVKAVIATDDAAAAGTVNVVLEYLAN